MTEPGETAARPPVVWEAPASSAPGGGTTTGQAPMSSNDIFQRAIELYQKGFVVLVTVAAVVQIPLAVIGLVLGRRVADAFGPLAALGQNPSAADFQAAFQKAFSDAGPSLGTIGLVSFVAGLLLSPALIATAARLYGGSTPTIAEAYGKALSAAPSIFIGSILQGVALFLVFFAILAAGIVLAVVFQGDAGLAALGVFLGFVVGAVVAVYIAIRWCVWSVAVVLEGRGPLDALGRSWRLVDRNMWRSLAILVVTGLVAAIAGAILGAIGGAIGGAVSPAFGGFVAEVLGIVTVSWFPIVLTLLFLDLRTRQAGPATVVAPPEAAWPTTAPATSPEPGPDAAAPEPSPSTDETPPSAS